MSSKMIFTHEAVRTFFASKIVSIDQSTGRSKAKKIDGPDFVVVTRHTSEAAAIRTAKSTTHNGYCKVLKSGEVREIQQEAAPASYVVDVVTSDDEVISSYVKTEEVDNTVLCDSDGNEIGDETAEEAAHFAAMLAKARAANIRPEAAPVAEVAAPVVDKQRKGMTSQVNDTINSLLNAGLPRASFSVRAPFDKKRGCYGDVTIRLKDDVKIEGRTISDAVISRVTPLLAHGFTVRILCNDTTGRAFYTLIERTAYGKASRAYYVLAIEGACGAQEWNYAVCRHCGAYAKHEANCPAVKAFYSDRKLDTPAFVPADFLPELPAAPADPTPAKFDIGDAALYCDVTGANNPCMIIAVAASGLYGFRYAIEGDFGTLTGVPEADLTPVPAPAKPGEAPADQPATTPTTYRFVGKLVEDRVETVITEGDWKTCRLALHDKIVEMRRFGFDARLDAKEDRAEVYQTERYGGTKQGEYWIVSA